MTWLAGLFCTALTPMAWGAEEVAVVPAPDSAIGTGHGVSALDVIGPDAIVPIPENYTVTTHVYREGEGTSTLAALPEKLIYSNTLGQRILKFNIPNRRYADDIVTDSVNGCNLTRYIVRVNGGVPNGFGEFSCKTALFEGCPTSAGGGVLIPGTEGDFQGMADDITEMHDLVVDVSASPIPIPPTVWVRVECNTALSGWVGSVPAELGFTQDRFFHPATGCDSRLGPTFYAGFYLQIYADDPPAMPCQTHFVAYASTSPTLPALNCGAGQACADDFVTILAPTGESCILSAYEVGMRGSSGPFSMTLDLRFPFTDFPIVGTEFTFAGIGDNRVEIARYVIDPALDIIIPASELWVKWEADRNNTGLINARFPAAGFSKDEFFARFLSPPPAFWAPLFVNPRAAVYLIIYCKGDTPRGACCRNQLAGNGQPIQCTDNLPITGCLRPGRWLKDRTCAQNQFQPPCGEHACCTPGGCQDATFAECATFQDPTSLGLPCTNNSHCPGRVCQPDGFCSPRAGVWQIGGFCDPGVPIGIPFECAFYQCYFASGDCFDPEEEICCGVQFGCSPSACPPGTKCDPGGVCTNRAGCNNIFCCNEVCATDTFCCEVAWDGSCVNRAVQRCELPPGNDLCANDSSPSIGAQALMVNSLGNGRYEAFTDANNAFAVANAGDPFACCNKAGADVPVAGTLWYKFVMPTEAQQGIIQPTTARIHTCSTPGSNTAIDAVLALFSVGVPGNEATECSTLNIVACADDREDCGSGQQADICVENLVAGLTYYIMLGSSNSAFQGQYNLEVEIPCNRILPVNNTCDNAQTIPTGSPVALDFSLLNATIDCPGEDCVNALKNDVWYEFAATCLGKATFQTCGPTVNDEDPDTALVVYRVTNLQDTCDVDTADVVGCNDDALVNTAEHGRRSQTCEFSGLQCDTSASCEFRCSVGGGPCITEKECHYCLLQPTRSCNDNADCFTCFFAVNGAPVSCTVPSAPQVPTAECPGLNNSCRFTSDNSCFKPHDMPPDFIEACVKEPCNSSCGTAASVTIPVTPGAMYKVRLGGDFGAEPDGVLTVTCTQQDCNNNQQPDLKEIQMGTAIDCNENEEIDACEIAAQPSRDCNNNGKLDVCEINRDSVAPGGPFFCIGSCAADCNSNGKIDSCDIAACTNPNNPACKDCNTNGKPDSCDIANGTSMDVLPPTGVPDECVPNACTTISSSSDCYIDPLQPHGVLNAVPAQGILTLDLVMNTGCTASSLPPAITVSVHPAGGPVPAIQSVTGTGNMATITFATPIPPNKWTCVSLTLTPAQQVCVGFLSGDVDRNRANAPATDAPVLIAALNSVPTPALLTQADMNRSNILTAEDLITYMNLLNGADAFIPWLPQNLPPCP